MDISFSTNTPSPYRHIHYETRFKDKYKRISHCFPNQSRCEYTFLTQMSEIYSIRFLSYTENILVSSRNNLPQAYFIMNIITLESRYIEWNYASMHLLTNLLTYEQHKLKRNFCSKHLKSKRDFVCKSTFILLGTINNDTKYGICDFIEQNPLQCLVFKGNLFKLF